MVLVARPALGDREVEISKAAREIAGLQFVQRPDKVEKRQDSILKGAIRSLQHVDDVVARFDRKRLRGGVELGDVMVDDPAEERDQALVRRCVVSRSVGFPGVQARDTGHGNAHDCQVFAFHDVRLLVLEERVDDELRAGLEVRFVEFQRGILRGRKSLEVL